MKLINLTPHTTNIHKDGKEVKSIESSGIVRLETSRKLIETVDGIDYYETELGEVSGLPDPEPDTRYIVSGLVRAAVNRPDLYQPGELIRDENGRPIGCEGLSK